eukprot:6201421-Pleurochrysis_carterae.AAC.3
MERERLLLERRKLLEKRARDIESFDFALARLAEEKLKLAADLKTTDLRKLVLFQARQRVKASVLGVVFALLLPTLPALA